MIKYFVLTPIIEANVSDFKGLKIILFVKYLVLIYGEISVFYA